MDYMDIFKEHYKEYFRGISSSRLVEQEERLSKLLDDDEFSHVLLIDEAIAMYELIRDECVCRVCVKASSDE